MKYLLRRTLAYLIDCIIVYGAAMILIQWALLSQFREQWGITEEWFRVSTHMQIYVLLTISIPVWSYFALMDSKVSRGTLGKRLLKARVIQKTKPESPGIGRSYLRTFFKLLPWEIAHVGVIFPTPLYFENEAKLRVWTYVGILLLIGYALSIILSKKGQTIYDYTLGTQVISYGKSL
jgi:uncharacterized RDD family membrane protein YckC